MLSEPKVCAAHSCTKAWGQYGFQGEVSSSPYLHFGVHGYSLGSNLHQSVGGAQLHHLWGRLNGSFPFYNKNMLICLYSSDMLNMVATGHQI